MPHRCESISNKFKWLTWWIRFTRPVDGFHTTRWMEFKSETSSKSINPLQEPAMYTYLGAACGGGSSGVLKSMSAESSSLSTSMELTWKLLSNFRTRWVGAIASSKWDLAKWGSEITESQDLHTHLKRNTDLTGNHNRIAPINSPGKMVAARVAFLIIFLCQLVRVSNGMTPSSVHQSYSRRVRCKKINSRRVQMFHTPWVRMSLSYLIFFF